jgi:tRNA(Ile)-lysidine synthase
MADHHAVLERPGDLPISSMPAGRLLVAVSGGPDSTALLLALHESRRDIVVAHYDHALRDGSEAVARQVAALCAALGVPLIAERRREEPAKGSLQAAARTLRYSFLERARAAAGAEWVATAHTADDLVEGVVLHMLRGCGLAGFRGMPARRGRYVRPMLQVWRSEVSAFLEQRRTVAHHDPSNQDERFARVRARLHILPALERDRPGITARFHAAALAAGRFHEAAEAAASGPVTRSRIQGMAEPAAAEVLKRIYLEAGGSQPGLSRSHVRAMLEIAGPGRGGRGVDLPGGLRFRIVGELMQVVPTQHPSPAPFRLEITACSGCDRRDAVHLRQGIQLHVGHRRPGLRMRPLGGRGTRKLQDIFVDERIPREDRDAWPLVFAGERLAWVPGLAVDADLVSPRGEQAQHLALTPMPVPPASKVVRLETPRAPGARRAQEFGDLS